MGLAAAEEAADPRGGLFRLALVIEVGLQDANKAAPILAFANEMRELEAQRAAVVLGQRVAHGRHAAVRQGDFRGVALVDVSIAHDPRPPYTPIR